MYSSRLGKYQERKLTKRLLLALFGSIALIVFVIVFGLRILISFSILVEKLKGANATTQSTPVVIMPPVLDPLPEATNSATLNITGSGQAGMTLVLYLNDTETKKLTLDKNGNFTILNLPLKDGQNTLKAQLTDSNGNKSDYSNTVTTAINRKQPGLDINQPVDNSQVNGDDNTLTVTGKTDEGNSVTVNGRVAVVNPGGSFSYKLQLANGDNTIEVIATDNAGNQTIVERKVTYQP